MPLPVLGGTMNEGAYQGRWWHALEGERIQCDLCPRECRLGEGQRGACFVRQNVHGGMVLTTYGRLSGIGIDPIEKKPLHHFLPGTRVLSFGTLGCNLMCKFCQNWDISKSKDMERLRVRATPEEIARAAKASGCASVAFTYNDPVVFAEYAMDTADACHERGIHTVAVTAGYIHSEPRRAFFCKMDAANVDLKAFRDEFYQRRTGAHLQPVLDTLRYLRHETDTWLEITTLLIPGDNDSDAEVKALCGWIADELGVDVPLHLSAFHPDYLMTDLLPTPKATLTKARDLALAAGLQYVYIGNVRDLPGGSTSCPACRALLIRRDGYHIEEDRLTPDGTCPDCGRTIPGRFNAFARSEPYPRNGLLADLPRS